MFARRYLQGKSTPEKPLVIRIFFVCPDLSHIRVTHFHMLKSVLVLKNTYKTQ